MLFFIMFLITFIKFFPTFVVSAIRYKLYKEKFEISYFSQFFSGQPIFVNVINFIPGMSSYPVQNTILIAKITHLLSCSLIVSVTYP